MTIRAKFRCVEKKDMKYYDTPATTSVILAAVTGDGNKTWAKYTPSGRVELSIDNPDAFAAFKLGEFYFLDFTIAPAKEADEK